MSAAVGSVSEALVDRIYECAFTPEHCPGVFDELAKIPDARGGFLLAANRKVINWTASASLQEGSRLRRWRFLYEKLKTCSPAVTPISAGVRRLH
jgi:hypothetical protein